MIHNSSSDPVLIKKISLKIWSLRDEIEARIQDQMDAGEVSPQELETKISELQSEYTKKTSSADNNILQLKSAEDLASGGEDEMEKAMAAAMEGNDEASEEVPEVLATPEVATSENVVTMKDAAIDGNIINISIETPSKLSEDKISKGKTILSEIGMEKMFFFSNKAYTEGQSIVVQFCIPKSFIVNADVLYCRPFNIKSRIISQNNYTHRMLIKFNFLKEGERALLRQFIQSIEPDLSKIVKKIPVESTENDESDFSDLDDLGL